MLKVPAIYTTSIHKSLSSIFSFFSTPGETVSTPSSNPCETCEKNASCESMCKVCLKSTEGNFFCKKCSRLKPVCQSLDFFELFDIPESFDVDKSKLVKEFRNLQTKLHPDRFSSADHTPDELCTSHNHSSRLNIAFNTLNSPLQRSIYLLSLKKDGPERAAKVAEAWGESSSPSVDVDEVFDKKAVLQSLGTEFLMEQMEIREEVDSGHFDSAEKAAESLISTATKQFKQGIAKNDYLEAEKAIIKMQYGVKTSELIREGRWKLIDDIE
eukprot:gnl/Carplike_NY0171/5404_a7380_227.p1 GENE.gnl/Carplike_NY0171/5404_a7380_227~~gnl/Carplike_NY0171/5404_a7380_227.p1  ORF type:complete len:283 (+),score=28.08 gnl/Carplike_NY0171/5404_a7380_227:41-850(+)